MKDSYVTTIYKGIVKSNTLIDIHKQIFKDTINFYKVNGFSPESFKRQAFAYAKQVKRIESDGIGLGLIGLELIDYVFRKMNENKMMDTLDHEVFETARKIEASAKQEIIDKDTNVSEMKKTGKTMTSEDVGLVERDDTAVEEISNHLVWYLVSWHGDCARDHDLRQGRIYIDENWRNICNEGERKIIQDYINANGVRTFQWVIGRPVWLITRPNCRHYYKKLYTSTVINSTVQTLLAKNNMTSPVGKKRNLQTITHSTNIAWYKTQNVNGIIWQYEKRLAMHKKMQKIKNCPELQKAIKKDRLLIRKWKEYKRNFL